MDMSNQKLKALTWEPYNMAIEDHNQPPFDLTQWSNNYSLIHDHHEPSSSSTQLHLHGVPNNLLGLQQEEEEPGEELGAMKEMMFKIAAMQPVDIDPATIHKPKRRNVRISDDPQSVAARHRRERISEKIRILQRLVPGGTKMDTASMLDEAARYVKFLKRQIRLLQSNQHQTPFLALTTDDNNNNNNNNNSIFGSSAPFSALAISNNNNNSNNDNNNNLSSSAAVGGTSYMFGGNNINIDGANHNDDTVCFNYNKFIGYY